MRGNGGTNSGLWPAAVMLAAVWGIGLMGQVALSGVAVYQFGFDEAGAALLALLPGIGVAVGSVLAPRFHHPGYAAGLPIIGGTLLGAALILSAQAASGGLVSDTDLGFYLTCGGLILAGVGIAAIAIPLSSHLHRHSPGHLHGAVFAIAGMLSILAILAGNGLLVLTGRLGGGSVEGLAVAGVIALVLSAGMAVRYRLHAASWLMTMLLRLRYRVQVTGSEHLPNDGGCLVVCNHQSYADGPLLFANLPRQARFLVYGGYVKHPIIGAPLRAAGAIPVAGDGSRRDLLASINAAVNAAKNGETVVIFPEGKLTRNGAIDRFQAGMERIAMRAEVPVIPACIDGLCGSILSRTATNLSLLRRFIRRLWATALGSRRQVGLRLGPALPASTSAATARTEVVALQHHLITERSGAPSLGHAVLSRMRQGPSQPAVTDTMGSLNRQNSPPRRRWCAMPGRRRKIVLASCCRQDGQVRSSTWRSP